MLRAQIVESRKAHQTSRARKIKQTTTFADHFYSSGATIPQALLLMFPYATGSAQSKILSPQSVHPSLPPQVPSVLSEEQAWPVLFAAA